MFGNVLIICGVKAFVKQASDSGCQNAIKHKKYAALHSVQAAFAHH
jgi:hypothetical protein